MRSVVLVLLVGCGGAPDLGGTGDDGPGGPPECAQDADCAAAAARCCDCPAFAVPTRDELHQACVDVICPEAVCSDSEQVACRAGRCVLACVVTACATSCADGYARDEAGCLSCACAAPVDGGCGRAADCVRVRADCCGCAHGGHDTAVLRRDARAHELGLMCDPSPQCPTVSLTCDAAAAVECQQGRCALSSAGPLPPDACGRPDLPACPPGFACVINGDSEAAQEQGVGVCRARGSRG